MAVGLNSPVIASAIMSTDQLPPAIEWQLLPGVAEQYHTAYQQRWKRRCEQLYHQASTRRVYEPICNTTRWDSASSSSIGNGQPSSAAPTTTAPTDRPFVLWADRRKTILEYYKTDRPVSVVPNIRESLQLPHSSSHSSDSAPPVVQQQQLQPTKPIFDSTRAPQPKDGRLDELYLYEDHANKLPRSNVSAIDYQQWCQQLLNDLLYYWIEASDRLSSLKLVVFAARQLCDTSNVAYYPVQYVYLTDVLTTFGDLVYTRIRSRGRQASSAGSSSTALPTNFHSTDVNERARETARNWFFRISTIRSVTIRVYLELALLKAYRFIIRTEEFARIIKRLSRSIRGIGDPMVAAYARCYLADRATDLSLSLVTPITQSSKPDVIESSITRSSSVSRSSNNSSDGTPPSSVHNTPTVDRKTMSRLPSNEQKQTEPLQRLIQYALPSDQKPQAAASANNNKQPAPRNRQAILVRTFHQTLIETWYDFVLTFHKCSNKQWSIVPSIAEQKLEPEQYIALFQPAVDYLCNIIGYHGRDELLQAVLSNYREQAHAHPMILTTIIKSFDSSLLVEKANEIIQLITSAAYNVDEQADPAAVQRPKSLEHVSDDQQTTDANQYKIISTYTPSLLYTHLGLALRRHAPPIADRLTILNTIWKHVAQLVDFYAYLQLACIYAPYVARQLTQREISIFAADVYQHIQRKRAGQMQTYLYKNTHIQNGVRNILTALYTEVPDTLYESVVTITSVNKLLNEVLDRSHRQQVLISCIQRLERPAASSESKPADRDASCCRQPSDSQLNAASTKDHLRTVQEASTNSQPAAADASAPSTCLRLTQTPAQQLLMEFCVLLAAHLTTASTADERLAVSNTIITFIRHLQFGRDVESHLQLLRTLSQSLSATPVPLHAVRAEILQHMLYLAVRTHKWCYGRHTAESSQFVTTCIQAVHQQLPTINELRNQLPLYVAAMEAALLCAQTHDKSERGQLSSLQLYLYRNAVSCIKITVNSIAGLSNVNQLSVDVPLQSLLLQLSSIILLLPPPSVTSPTQTSKSPLYYVSIFVDTVINTPTQHTRYETSESIDCSGDALTSPLADELPDLSASHRLLCAVTEMLIAAKHMPTMAASPSVQAEHNQLITDVILALRLPSQPTSNGSQPYLTSTNNPTMLDDWLQRLFTYKQLDQLLHS